MPRARVHPAQQRLDAVVGALIEADDRLVVDLELLELERPLELGLELEPLDHALVHRGLEDAVAALACRAWPCTWRRRRCGGAPRRRASRTPGRRGRCRRSRAGRPACRRPRTAARGRRRIRPATSAASAESSMPSRRMANSSPPKRATVSAGRTAPEEALRNLLEDRVAGRVAEAVVDGLEVVEVDEHDPDRRAAADRAHDRVLDAVCEQGAVGEVVTGSWKAWCASWSSNALRSLTSRPLRTMPRTCSS